MNKSDVVEIMALSAGISKSAAEKALIGMLDGIAKAVADGETVNFVGFGSFKSSVRAAREGKNPKTGEKINIPATTVPKFSPGASFKAIVAKK